MREGSANLTLGAGEEALREQVAALYAVVLLGSFMHAARRQEDAAELAAGGLAALARARLAAVAWYDDDPVRRCRLVGRCGGTHGIPTSMVRPLARFCSDLPTARSSRHDGGQLPGALRVAGIHALVAVPLRVSTECLGFLLAADDDPDFLDDLTLIQALGTQTATALFVARLQETETARVSELDALTAVLREQGDLLSRTLHLQESLIDLVLHGRDAATIVEHLAFLMGAPLWLLDAAGVPIAHAGGEQGDPPPLPSPDDLRRALDKLRRDQDPLPLEITTAGGAQPVLVQSVATDGEVFGFLVVRSGSLGQWGRSVLQGGRLVLALRLLMERSVAEAEERAGRDLIEDAVLRRRGGHTSAALAARLGYDQDGAAVVMAVRVRPGRSREHGGESARRRAALEVRDEVRSLTRGLVGALGDETVCVVRPEAADPCGRRILKRLSLDSGVGPVTIGVSDPRSSLEDLEGAYREALTAVALAEGLSRDLLHFADLGLYRLLFDLEHVERIDEHIDRWLGPLLAYDALHHTDLVETLACHLAGTGRDEVAAELSIHPSTLKYRLRRIREILAFDFGQAESRFNIELALRLAQSRRAIR